MKPHARASHPETLLVADCRLQDNEEEKPKNMPWWKDETVLQVGSALLYAVVATSMSIINRLCLLVFPLPTVVLLVQMASTMVILYPLLLAHVLNFSLFNPRRFKSLLGISFLYTANTAFALFGLKGMNLPMYTAIKRLTPMTILIIKSVWKRKWPHPRITASVGLVVVGCLVAGAGDLSFDGTAYLFAFGSVLVQALYLLLVEFQSDVAGASTSELLWYNAMQSLPLLLLITAANGDFTRVAQHIQSGSAAHGAWYFYFMVVAASTMGCLLNYSMFLCTMHNSALTTTIVGVLRGVVTIVLGFFVDTVKFHVLNILGLTLNTLGGVWYTWLKYLEKYGLGPVISSSKQQQQQQEYVKVQTEEDWADGGGSAEGHVSEGVHRRDHAV
ncbi:hypothetical protein OEZ86_013896 [Tetradesmus obliquus]|nr:hypothetical protein OEZ86_013896 [Tetradesmus obliquus]